MFLSVMLFGLLMALLASRKGYNPLCWFLAAGVVGLIFLAFQPYTNKGDLSEGEASALRSRGNKTGALISGGAVALAVVLNIARS